MIFFSFLKKFFRDVISFFSFLTSLFLFFCYNADGLLRELFSFYCKGSGVFSSGSFSLCFLCVMSPTIYRSEGRETVAKSIILSVVALLSNKNMLVRDNTKCAIEK